MWDFVFLAALAIFALVTLLAGILVQWNQNAKVKPVRKSDGRVRETAAVLARYFGTWREAAFWGDPVACGRRVVEFLSHVSYEAEGVELLMVIAHEAIGRQEFPIVQTPGTEAFEQVASAIGNVCRWLSENPDALERAYRVGEAA